MNGRASKRGADPQALLDRAVAAHRAGDLAAAASGYRAVLAVTPDNVPVLHNLALVLQQGGRREEALAPMRKALRLAPADASLHANLGNFQREAGRREDAIASYRRALELNPGHANARYNLGTALAAQGDHAGAQACFRTLLAKHPEDDGLNAALCESLLASSAVDEADARVADWLGRRPHSADAHLQASEVARARDDHESAERSLRRAIELAPVRAEAWNNLAGVLLRLERPDEAETAAREALRLQPGYDKATVNLAGALLALRRGEEAVAMAGEATRLQPDAARPWLLLVHALNLVERPRQALEACRRCVALDPDDEVARYELASLLLTTGDMAGGMQELDTLLTRNPEHASAWSTRAAALLDMGRFDEARDAATRAAELAPELPEPWMVRLKLDESGEPPSEIVERLERILDVAELNEEARANTHFALAAALERAGEHPRAFAHYRSANELLKARLPWDPVAHEAYVDAVLRTFDAGFFAMREGWGSDSQLPVFIVGMPRSGTTLVEQILASHPQVTGAGELTLMPELARDLGRETGGGYPRGIATLSAERVASAADAALATLAALAATGSTRVTDKLPPNFIHLGLIALLFPRARIIHCRREPLDVLLSNYTQRFSLGNQYCYDLDHLLHYYRQYRRLMGHWDEVLPGRVFPLRYETLVDEQERVSRELVAHLGLDWDPRCLVFHRTERAVHTASHVQVRKPMFRSSVARWQHYAEQLEPLRAALAADEAAAGDG